MPRVQSKSSGACTETSPCDLGAGQRMPCRIGAGPIKGDFISPLSLERLVEFALHLERKFSPANDIATVESVRVSGSSSMLNWWLGT